MRIVTLSARLTLSLSLPIVACVMPPSGPALMQQTAQQFNFDMRFGRTEAAMEQIAPKYADEFVKRHRGWGSAVHVTDAETVSMRPKGPENYDVSVRVGWYRAEEGDLHTTMLKQKWHLYPRGWLLDAEERVEGDIGALGENVEVVAPDLPSRNVQFPTVRLSTD